MIATLVNIKKAMVELILKPAGVPLEAYAPFLLQRDVVSGRPLSKRQMAPLILDAVEKRPDCSGVVRTIIEIAAHWSSFHLADDEFAASAAVQKAREIIGTIELMEAREAKQRDLVRKEELLRMERERAESFVKQSELLLILLPLKICVVRGNHVACSA